MRSIELALVDEVKMDAEITTKSIAYSSPPVESDSIYGINDIANESTELSIVDLNIELSTNSVATCGDNGEEIHTLKLVS